MPRTRTEKCQQKRCTIKAHNLPFLDRQRTETGIEDLTELVNYLLLEYRWQKEGKIPVNSPPKMQF
ncbi:hypothetical protein [Kamptonema formosum]|uniref:hypothetical protein n=1 Tax=Kamptonema formosum TaxID=331992 RepID=UPI000348146A|nr:hypothetical protein [Oscillatoria sp. PCC 10802]